ncbi:alpha/beta hydrolase [Alkalibacter rhizosphaerae]|uniref:Alpha/beta hydrolase n=1 Tax=Alkalibacter rhizosphaerae TaxID=2815577 RepID=A0A975AID8_9FIRM|nr:alpha/beta hydrolase [Alkalibacter rhizosphaerae]QSX08574.1 alpha/beta hydrolase [Alkalibacter rhizosphaerae]
MRSWKKIVVFLLLFLQVFPFFIPLKNKESIPEKPYYNSYFYEGEGTSIHWRLYDSFKNRGNVLMIHGLGGSTYSWEQTAQRLQQEGFDVVAVDLPGFGYSERTLDFVHTQQNRGELLWNVLDHVKEDYSDQLYGDHWILIGHSMGGGTATAMALTRQDQTDVVILAAGALFDNGRTMSKVFYYPPAGKWMEVFLDRFGWDENRIAGILESANGQPVLDGQVEGYLQPLKIKNTGASLVQMVKTSKSLEDEELRALQVPVYGIWGDQDDWVAEIETERIRLLIPQARFAVIPGAGHLAMETHPEAFQKHLLQFLSTLE